jgi:hypothetical protein
VVSYKLPSPGVHPLLRVGIASLQARIDTGNSKSVMNLLYAGRLAKQTALPLQRFNLMATTSYAALDIHWKGHLKHLHDDYLESRQVSIILCCLPWGPPCTAAHLAACQRS